jgi:hypothetical protein
MFLNPLQFAARGFQDSTVQLTVAGQGADAERRTT